MASNTFYFYSNDQWQLTREENVFLTSALPNSCPNRPHLSCLLRFSFEVMCLVPNVQRVKKHSIISGDTFCKYTQQIHCERAQAGFGPKKWAVSRCVVEVELNILWLSWLRVTGPLIWSQKLRHRLLIDWAAVQCTCELFQTSGRKMARWTFSTRKTSNQRWVSVNLNLKLNWQ